MMAAPLERHGWDGRWVGSRTVSEEEFFFCADEYLTFFLFLTCIIFSSSLSFYNEITTQMTLI